MIALSPSQGALAHTLLEALAYLAAGRYFIRLRRLNAALTSPTDALWICASAAAGAALGSKILFWLQYPEYVLAHLDQPALMLGGKTIVGGLLGGLTGVEFAKRVRRVTASTGDVFVFPLILGIMIGRLGCAAAGLEDNTYGSPTTLPWAVTYADGVPRHPVAVYEILFLGALWAVIAHIKPRLPATGDAFRLFMSAYLAFRFIVDFLKPPHSLFRSTLEAALVPPAHLYFGALTAIQLACLAGLAYYAANLRTASRRLSWQR